MVQSFGQLTVSAAGTPVRATSNLASPNGSPVLVQSFLVQAAPENTGVVYVMARDVTPGDDRTNRAYVVAILGKPASTDGPFPGSSYVAPAAGGKAVDLRHIWLDASLDNQKAIVSAVHEKDGRYV